MTTLLDQAVCAEVDGSDRVLVVGVGDDRQRDDGVGPAVVRRLCGRTDATVRIRTVTGTAEELRNRWGRAHLVVMVLAARHDSPRPGTVHMLATELPRGHTEPGATLLDRLAGLPHRVVVYTVEGASFASGTGLSPDVEATVRRLADHIERQIAAVPFDRPSLPDQRGEPARKNVIGWPADTGRPALVAGRPGIRASSRSDLTHRR
ncbi:MAG TPA: hydrogenase maturation protease [Micromonosporaceae bacterium]